VPRPRREEALVDVIGDAAIWPCAGGARIDLPASSLPNDAGHAMDAADGLLFVDDVVTFRALAVEPDDAGEEALKRPPPKAVQPTHDYVVFPKRSSSA
jgi:hypothetical protein